MFSVLISLYNKENPKYLDECLNSLVCQDLKASEIIIVFDGAISEELANVVSIYEKALNIKILKLNENLGLGKALNLGLEICSYDLVARMDTDDICLPNRFSKQIKYMEDNTEVSMIGSSIDEFDEYNNHRLKKLPSTFQDIKEFSKWKNPFNHMTVIFRKKDVIEAGGYVHHLFMEDYNLWLRMLSSGYELRNMKEVLVRARVGSDMIKKRRGIKYILSEYKLAKLKNKLKITNYFEGFFIFLTRSITRLIPVNLLRLLYKIDRK